MWEQDVTGVIVPPYQLRVVFLQCVSCHRFDEISQDIKRGRAAGLQLLNKLK
jgi:hypothetical protein